MPCGGTIAGLVAGVVLAASEPVLIGTEAPFPPYTLVQADGSLTGHDRELMDEICSRLLWRCEWENVHFDELIPGVMSGRFDIVLGGMAVTEERLQIVDFTQSYDSSDPEEWYLGHFGAPEPSAALISVQSGTVQEAHLRKSGYDYRSFVTEPEVLEAVIQGEVDLAFGPFSTRDDLTPIFEANKLEFLYSEMVPDGGIAIAVCKGNTELLESLNKTIEALRADGTLEALENRWF